jgi:hypothetical protein
LPSNLDVDFSTPESFKLEYKGGSVSCDNAKESIIDPDVGIRYDDHDSDVGITNVPKKEEKRKFLPFARTAPRPTSAVLDLSTGNDSPRPFGGIAQRQNCNCAGNRVYNLSG